MATVFLVGEIVGSGSWYFPKCDENQIERTERKCRGSSISCGEMIFPLNQQNSREPETGKYFNLYTKQDNVAG